MHEIDSVGEFRKMKQVGVGFVVIVDKPNRTKRLHHTDCPHVEESNFVQKVIANRRENGRYLWVESIIAAKESVDGLYSCLVCRQNSDAW